MKKFIVIFSAIFFIISLSTFKTVSAAPTFTYPSYDVDININKDSTFTVKETFVYSFYGEVHGVRRDIKTFNNSCSSRTDVTCGGFDRLELLAVYDENDKKVDPSDFTTSTYQDEDSGDEFYRIERTLFPNGQEFSGERVKWSIEYKIYGGLKWFGENPMFYWNVIPDEMNGSVNKATVNINFPSGTNYKSQNFQIYDDYGKDPNVTAIGNKVTLSMRNLGSTGALTVSYKFQPDEITKPATLNYAIQNPPFGNSVFINGIDISEESSGSIDNIPAGDVEIKFTHTGYKDYIFKGTLQPGEVKTLDINLETEVWMSFLLLLNTLLTCLGIFFVPAAVIYVVIHYRRKGVDKNMQKTIIPLFKPPVDVPPYLLGTIKDETVDKEDIVGSIIDLAYRGYIKIKEIKKGKVYELTRLEGKKGDPGLSSMEEQIMTSVFRNSDVVKTTEMRNYFYLKFMLLKIAIYKEVVDKGFFTKSPESIRNNYVGCGTVLFILGIISSCFFSTFGTTFLGYLVLCTPLLGLITLGFGFIVASKYMPAKTEKGSKVYADILGFRMYLNTAERYTLQNLEPEDFEKYLSYAVVFGIEKQWAEKFKDIYNKVPDWYEGSNPGVWDAFWVSSLVRDFSNSTITNMAPASSSGTRGGGWSGGGGSFGGFSGGGGGGGSSGGF
ncbi:MAG: DUF2207 domain-containing protein [Candidatus Dojkabacteria bacterium]